MSSNKSFGILFSIVFLILGLWPLKNSQDPNYYIIIIALVFLLLGVINSKILTPLNKAWVKFGEILGRIVAPIVMALVYFIILTPISLIMRILGKDLLELKKTNNDTYWIKREKNIGTMDKQF
tara:strand:+ start:183 stop:551 length:369 start_codon:yes stop_codon:yes gene_type:complete